MTPPLTYQALCRIEDAIVRLGQHEPTNMQAFPLFLASSDATTLENEATVGELLAVSRGKLPIPTLIDDTWRGRLRCFDLFVSARVDVQPGSVVIVTRGEDARHAIEWYVLPIPPTTWSREFGEVSRATD